MSSETLRLAQELIAKQSITPEDGGCQQVLAARLDRIGFRVQQFPAENVKNFYARKGQEGPVLLFAGHTDVVPPGNLDNWTNPPFQPTVKDNVLYGRGAADMKSSLAAMVCAVEKFEIDHPNHKGSIAFLITSDEEGPAENGTKFVVEQLLKRQEQINWCIVGEASSENMFGDVVKIGRRGSLSGDLVVQGRQGHVAYPQKASNPIHNALQPLAELSTTAWDQGNQFFPPTSFQISNIHAGTGANNVIPGTLEAKFNFRFSTEVTAEQLKARVHEILDKHGLRYTLHWESPGQPFLSKKGELFQATRKAVQKVARIEPKPMTDGGTSDGRFIINLGCEVLELGPLNGSIHQVDENITVAELSLLTDVYYEILVNLLT